MIVGLLVCGGIAEHFGWSRFGTRLAFAIVSLLTAVITGIVVYAILCLLMPPPSERFHLDEVLRQ